MWGTRSPFNGRPSRHLKVFSVVGAIGVLLTACAHSSDVKPGAGRKANITERSYDAIWMAAYKVADEHFEILEQDKTRGFIRYERTMTAIDGGSYGGIYITPSNAGASNYTVEVVRVLKNRFQLTSQDWEYKVLRDIFRQLGLPALDPTRDP